MAITTAVYKKNINNVGVWSGADVINQLEDAFTGLGWHSQDDQGGYIVGIKTHLGGGTNYDERYKLYNVEGYHSGVGTGAIFSCHRNSSGLLHQVAINHSGYGYTGGELITIPAESIGAPVGQDLVLYPYVHSAINGGVSYAISCTHTNSGDFAVAGNDRNGVVSGAYTTITIKEGDTITFSNDGTFSGFDLAIIRGTHDILADDISQQGVANVINQYADLGEELVWTPLRGQAGEYALRDSNYYLGSGQYEQTNIIVQSAQDNDVTYPVIGTTTGFYYKNLLGADNDHPCGVLRNLIQPGKKKGITYNGFQILNGDTSEVCMGSCPYFFPFNYSDTINAPDASSSPNGTTTGASDWDMGHGYAYRWGGIEGVDVAQDAAPFSGSSISYLDARAPSSIHNTSWAYYTATGESTWAIETGNNTTFQLDLNVFRSGIDPNFAVLSFRSPTLSATNINGNTFGTFFLHKFTTNLWDLDHVFLSGHTQILRESSTTTDNPWISFRTFLNGTQNSNNQKIAARGSAEMGYNKSHYNYTYARDVRYVETYYNSMTHPHDTDGEINYNGSNIHSYYRNEADSPWRNGRWDAVDNVANTSVGSVVDSNAVLKGLPINASLMPVPYYLPDDFVMIQFYYGSVNANIQQGDTVTVSPSEIYTVIAGSYNMTTDNVTRGVLFCGRKV